MKEMYKGVVNSPETTITNDISSTDTLIYVLDDSRVPDDLPNLMTIGTGTNAETVKVVSKAGSAITVVRGFQGIAKSWPAGSIIARNFTEYDYNALMENINTLREDTDTIEDDILELMSYVGDLESLDTNEKANIVLALNEIYQDLNSHKADNTAHVPHLGITTNSGNNYSITSTKVINDGEKFSVKFNTAATGTATLKISSDGTARTLKKPDGNDFKPKAGVYSFIRDGVNFQLLGEGGEYGNAQAQHVLSPYTIGTENGVIQGTIPSKGAQSYNPSQSVQIISAGQYLSGNQTIQPVTFDASKVLNDTIIAGKQGTMPNQGRKIIIPSTTNIAIPQGYHDGTGYVQGIPTYKEISDINIMVKCDESADYGGWIYALTFDGTYLYAGGDTTNKVWKINPSTMSKVAESANYGGTILALAFDGAYLYAGGDTTKKVWKINPSTMSKVAESADYGGTIRALAFDGTYLYAGGGTTKKVWKINPSTMSKVAESADYGGTIRALAFDGTYLYAGGATTNRVWKIDTSTMSKVADSADYGGWIYALTFDGTYLYAGGANTTKKVWKINPSTMSKVAESADYGGAIRALAFDGTYLYAGGATTNRVWKIDTSTMSKVADSADYGGWIQALEFDGAYLYAGGANTTKKVWKITDTVYIREV